MPRNIRVENGNYLNSIGGLTFQRALVGGTKLYPSSSKGVGIEGVGPAETDARLFCITLTSNYNPTSPA